MLSLHADAGHLSNTASTFSYWLRNNLYDMVHFQTELRRNLAALEQAVQQLRNL